MNAIDDMTPGAQDVASRLVALIDELRPSVPDSSVGDRLGDIRSRLTGPLRVAIAGRVKAGKSTLLNALVGERLAPTDAGECTRLVSVYRQGPGYRVTASLKSGASRELVFRRESGHLDVELGDLDDNDVAHLEVDWPTSTLATTTLIDTPGLASANDDNSRRTPRVPDRRLDRTWHGSRRSDLPDEARPPIRHRLPRCVHGPVGHCGVAGECRRGAVAC